MTQTQLKSWETFPVTKPTKSPADYLSVGFANHDLCTRCGTCGGICPTGAVAVDPQFFPTLIDEKCTKCGLCAKACPGGIVDFEKNSNLMFGKAQNHDNYCGHYLEGFIGHATDHEIRSGGSSGGIVTQLLIHLLETGRINGAIVTIMDPATPHLGKAYIARSRDELLPSRQSKYTVVPVNRILAEVQKSSGVYALVALPCQIHGFRKWSTTSKRLLTKVPYVIGLYCLTSFETNITTDLMRVAGFSMSKLTEFQFRGGEWPGHIRVRDDAGAFKVLHQSNFKDGAINYLTRLYSPTRCKMCIDGSAEFADISVADGWTRDKNGDYLFNRRSMFVVRTEKGREIVKDAIDSGKISAEKLTDSDIFRTHVGLQRFKKRDNPVRIERWRRRGKQVPEYNWRHVGSLKDRVNERISSLTMILGKNSVVRLLLLKFLLSKIALPLVWIRQWRKARKFAA